MGGIFLVVLLLLGSFFSYSFLSVNKDIKEPIRTTETNRVIEKEKSYINDKLNSYFEINDEN